MNISPGVYVKLTLWYKSIAPNLIKIIKYYVIYFFLCILLNFKIIII